MFKFRQPINFIRLLGLIILICFIYSAAVWAQDAEESVISDNSFLIEEAYNQEPGVVQHIFNWVPSWENGIGAQRNFDFVFTQEWPVFSQKHQLSYSIPFTRYDEEPVGGGGAEAGGLGDIMLNYRYQLLNDGEGDFVACSPRFTFIFPSGDEQQGLGNGELGYQFNIPISKTYDRWAFHFNAGMTMTQNVQASYDPNISYMEHDLNGYNIGGSAIYFLKPNFHLMLEQNNTWADNITADGQKYQECISILSPGFRWAAYTKDSTQWVLGTGLPVGLNDAAADIGVFFYMSFEHRFMKKQAED